MYEHMQFNMHEHMQFNVQCKVHEHMQINVHEHIQFEVHEHMHAGTILQSMPHCKSLFGKVVQNPLLSYSGLGFVL